MMTGSARPAASRTFSIGGDMRINRLGFGAMRITGAGIWGEPADRKSAIALLQAAVRRGVNFIDTADSYGPAVSENLIAEALQPYPADLVIATKGGLVRPGPDRWQANCRPEHLKQACESSLTRLKLDRIDLYQLHTVDPRVPIAESIGALVELQREGKIRHVGVSNVDLADLQRACNVATIVSVQNRYNLEDRTREDVLEACTRQRLAFLPWYPLAAGSLARSRGQLVRLARRYRASPSQVALAWLLYRSPVVVPIPGTSSLAHLEENLAAAELTLTEHDLGELAGERSL